MVPKNLQKEGEATGMPSLLVVPSQVMSRNNVGSLNTSRVSQLFTYRELSIALRVS